MIRHDDPIPTPTDPPIGAEPVSRPDDDADTTGHAVRVSEMDRPSARIHARAGDRGPRRVVPMGSTHPLVPGGAQRLIGR